MKFFAVAVFVVLSMAAFAEAGLTNQEAGEALRTISAGCVQEVGATEADLEVMVKHLPAQNTETKCLRACVMKKLDVMNPDGKFVRDVALKLAELHCQGEAGKMKIAEEVTAACADIPVSDDHCEAAESYKMCLTSEAKKHGVNMV